MKTIALYLFRNKQFSFVKLLPALAIYLLLLLPVIAVIFFYDSHRPIDYLTMRLVAAGAVFTLPVVFFYRNLKAYFYLLLIWILLSPVLIFFVIWLRVSLNFTFIALLLQTNLAEVEEATKGYRLLFLFITLSYVALYLLAVKKNTFTRLPFKEALFLSGAALLMLAGFAAAKRYKYHYQVRDILEETYPLSIFSGLYQAHTFMQKNNLKASKNFFFHAYNKDAAPGRKVYIFIIGESSRYDRWGVNGYSRPTTPKLSARPNLLAFSNVTSGCNLTWMSVPQMITRANPDAIDLQFKEKSIMAAFKDAGYKTVWLSNQGDKELFWSGTITLHAKTADVSLFNFPELPEPLKYGDYDERMLPTLDSILRSDTANLFCVVHTNGSHWTYPARYPDAFDVFKPSSGSQGLNPFAAGGREIISNTYDNSIRYSDYFIDSVIRMVEKHNLVSTVTFLSDHGEDIFDADPNKMNFHLNPAVTTLHVPLFVWTSDAYRKWHTEKVQLLAAHRDKKIGPENTFYTLLDLANISFPGFDSTRSVAGTAFQESTQKYYDDHAGKSFFFSDIVKWDSTQRAKKKLAH
jgi:glucan phosphoethanolaminetransferase (alkaline phosphatase superfamily)